MSQQSIDQPGVKALADLAGLDVTASDQATLDATFSMFSEGIARLTSLVGDTDVPVTIFEPTEERHDLDLS